MRELEIQLSSRRTRKASPGECESQRDGREGGPEESYFIKLFMNTWVPGATDRSLPTVVYMLGISD